IASDRPLPPFGLGDVHPADRLRPVRPAFQPVGEVLEVFFQRLAIVPPRLTVHARSRFPLEVEVRRPERFEVRLSQYINFTISRKRSMLLMHGGPRRDQGETRSYLGPPR